MNLSTKWKAHFNHHGIVSEHWSSVGEIEALDHDILDWARINHFVVMTSDLDFGIILALDHIDRPSVILLRSADLIPAKIGKRVIELVKSHEIELLAGALVIIDEFKHRVRILPI
jgi:predicted nuclease of predicted toxin-antitoxin system